VEHRMPTNEPFPLELFPSSVRKAILAEFKGRHPTNLQVARISDARWLSCPRIGPTMLARMRSVARGVHQRGRISPVASMTDIELLGRYELLQDELERIQAEIKASMTELGERGIVPRGTTIRQFRKSSAQPVHQEIG
jgi:hypothetical protein